MTTGLDRSALIRSYVLLALGSLGALRIYQIGIGTEPILVAFVSALLGIAVIPGRKT